MNLQSEKIKIAKLILETENPALLKSIMELFKKEGKTDFWKSLTSPQKEEIENGITEIQNEDIVDYDDFIKKYKK